MTPSKRALEALDKFKRNMLEADFEYEIEFIAQLTNKDKRIK